MRKRDTKCVITKGNFGGYIVHVYPNFAHSYYHTTSSLEEMQKYEQYYNHEKVYPNTPIFQRLHPEGIVINNKIYVRSLVIP